MTVKEAIDALNETHCHGAGFHVAMHNMEHCPEELANSDAMYHLMKQTYDWRYGKPEKEQYTVTLSGADMEYIGNALEIYNRVMFELHIEPALKRIITKMGEQQ